MGILDWFKAKKQPPPTGPAATVPEGQRTPHARPLPTPQDLMEAAKKLGIHSRLCFRPTTADGEGTASSSHFCGNAALRAGEAWPVCGECKLPMQLFVQLNSASLPPESGAPFGRGILQFFYCTADSCGDDCSEFSRGHLGRILPFGEEFRAEKNPSSSAYKTKLITGWNVIADYPDSEEAELLGAGLTREESEAFYERGTERFPVAGDKLLGWPYWVQGMDYLRCPTCSEKMRYIFQLDSEKNVPYMFGDCGVGHISICPKHPDRLAFRWSCC